MYLLNLFVHFVDVTQITHDCYMNVNVFVRLKILSTVDQIGLKRAAFRLLVMELYEL